MTDYDHPIDWETYTVEEKCSWYTEERVIRQVLRQAGVAQQTIIQEDTREVLTQVMTARAWCQYE